MGGGEGGGREFLFLLKTGLTYSVLSKVPYSVFRILNSSKLYAVLLDPRIPRTSTVNSNNL